MKVIDRIPRVEKRGITIWRHAAEVAEFIESGAHVARVDRYFDRYSADITAYYRAINYVLTLSAMLDDIYDIEVIPRNGKIYLKRVDDYEI